MTPEDYFAQELGKAEQAWTKDNCLIGLYDALALCSNNSLPLPEWTSSGLMGLIDAAWTGKVFEAGMGRNAIAAREAHERQKAFRRWERVMAHRMFEDAKRSAQRAQRQEAKALGVYDKWRKLPREKPLDINGICETVSREVQGTELEATADTIQQSYKKVRRDINAGRGYLYYAAGYRG